MLQQTAREIIADMRSAIARVGYENVRDKSRLTVVFGDIRRAYHMQPIPNLAKIDALNGLEEQWQRDRVGKPVFSKGSDAPTSYEPGPTRYGALTIAATLNALEQHISILLTETKPNFGYITVPTGSELAASAVLAELKKQGIQFASV